MLLVRDVSAQAALNAFRGDLAQQSTQKIAAVLTELTGEEERLLQERLAAAAASEAFSRDLAFGATATSLLLLLIAVRLLKGAQSRLLASAAKERALAAEMRASIDSMS